MTTSMHDPQYLVELDESIEATREYLKDKVYTDEQKNLIHATTCMAIEMAKAINKPSEEVCNRLDKAKDELEEMLFGGETNEQ